MMTRAAACAVVVLALGWYGSTTAALLQPLLEQRQRQADPSATPPSDPGNKGIPLLSSSLLMQLLCCAVMPYCKPSNARPTHSRSKARLERHHTQCPRQRRWAETGRDGGSRSLRLRCCHGPSRQLVRVPDHPGVLISGGGWPGATPTALQLASTLAT